MAPSCRPGGVSLCAAMAVAAFLSTFSGVVAGHFAGKPAPTQQVVVIDAARIAEARGWPRRS